MHSTAAAGGAAPSSSPTGRQGHLAIAFQEALMAVVRLRTGRQVAADADSFRAHLKRLLGQADSSAQASGYAPESVRLAVYAVIALIDESVLASSLPIFADWPRRPLQEEVFGEHLAGTVFFDNLNGLMRQQDSEELTDLLEVYLLCLLLGFQGRHSGGGSGDLAAIKAAVSDKIVRFRGVSGELTPDWAPPSGEAVPRSVDLWVRRLGIAALSIAGLAVLLWVVFFVSLRITG
jgi:type VI secretion system protein ImpK